MKITMVIPSYWARKSQTGWRKGDAVYDHPNPWDREGTLKRALESIDTLEDKDFQVVVIAVATSEDIETQVEKKVAGIIESVTADVEITLFGPSHLKHIHELLIDEGKKAYIDLLQLRGYSNIRNLCILIPHILGSDVAVLIDDDEVFDDPEFISKAKEFIGRKIGGKRVGGIAGYYIQKDNDYHIKKPFRPWMRYWDQYDRMNEAFDTLIGAEPRLEETPLVFGGNMVIHRDLFTSVPFDPRVSRGEDIDYLINARMFGFNFFIDNKLSIKHLPPQKHHPPWMQLREDIYRFIYERAKIESQRDVKGMTRVYPEDFDPYPGSFLKKNLEEKIEKSCKLLAEEYLAQGDTQSNKETLRNIALAKTDAVPKRDPFQNLCLLQKRWKEFMVYTSRINLLSSMSLLRLNTRRKKKTI
ncbi:MAG: hypothetical protein ACE5J5_02015 [Candidatus Hydrothermarchaeales archaeon]